MSRTVSYVEIYADEDGVSHFAERSLDIADGEVAEGMQPIGRSAVFPATECGFIAAPPGWVGGWHQPPAEGFVFVLAGAWEIETGDGEVRIFGPGSVWLHRDRSGRGHNTRVTGSDDALCVMVKFPEAGL